MDPLTLLAISGGLALGQGVASSSAGHRAAKENRAEADALKQKIKADDFGLSVAQKDAARRELIDPVKAGLAAQQRGNEAALATRGASVSGADLQALRRNQARGFSDASQAAAEKINIADLATAERQRQQAKTELAQRKQADAARKAAIVNSIFGTLTSGTLAAGKLAGESNMTENAKKAKKAAV